MDKEDCRRYRIDRVEGNYYITISHRAIMAHVPNPSAPDNATVYSLLNALFRVASKSRKKALSWGEIAYQISQSGVGHKAITDDIARIIQTDIKEDDWIDFNTVENPQEVYEDGSL